MAVNKVVFGAVAIMDISDSTVTEDTLAEGATAYGANGEKITGKMKAASDPVLQAKTVTPTTEKQTVTADEGYDGLSKVEVNAMPTATQATPSITVSTAGLITASATQDAGYVASGTKSATKQLTVQSAKTVTPTTSNQTAVASGRYTTGAVTVKGDANLKAENIKSGVSIFNVTGSYEGGSSGGSVEACTITVGYTSTDELSDDMLTFIYQDTALNSIKITRNSEWEFTEEGSSWMPEYVATITLENVAKNSFIYFYVGRTCPSQLATPLINTDNGINQYTVDVLWQVIGNADFVE